MTSTNAIVIFAAESWAVIVPILSVLVSGAFTFIGYLFNNRANEREQEIAEKSQDLDGIRLGKEFFQEALADARLQIADLKAQLSEVRSKYTVLQEEYEEQARTNEKLIASQKTHERKIRQLQDQLESLKENNKNG